MNDKFENIHEDLNTIQNMIENKRYQQAIEKSLESTQIQYESRKVKQKPKDYKKIVISTSLILMLGFTSSILGAKAIENTKAIHESFDKLDNPVIDNTGYGEYNEKSGERTWWYDTYDMANQVLTTNQNYDIESRVYGCYVAMNEYEKDNHMNSLFKDIKKIINEKPELYTPDLDKIISFETFNDYLENKNLSSKQYEHIMNKILTAYGKDNLEEVNILLNELDRNIQLGGTR